MTDPTPDFSPEAIAAEESENFQTRPNPMMRYSDLQLRASLASWAALERDKVSDCRGYGSDDRRTFKYRADLLDAAVARLVTHENAVNV